MKSTSQNTPVRLFLNLTALMILLATVSSASTSKQSTATSLARSINNNSKFAGKAIPKLPKRPGYRSSAQVV